MPSHSTFRSWNEFSEFEWNVSREHRFWHSEQTRCFLQTVVATSSVRTRVLSPGTELFRSQLGGHRAVNNRGGLVSEGRVEGPHRSERMKPRFDRANEGRANPSGIPVLYLATDPDTAVAELRPWPGQDVTLCKFRTVRSIRVVDCSIEERSDYIEEPSPELREISVWGAINEAFARPMSPEDASSGYAPTQTLADAFHSHGFEGIIHRSSCASGRNVVLFNQLLADPIQCTLCRVECVKYGWTRTMAIDNYDL